MKLELLPLADAVGHVLVHNVADDTGRRALRKGKPLAAEDVAALAALGRRSVYVARLEPGDVVEDDAARRLAEVVSGAGLRRSRALTGRVNFYAEARGVLRVDLARLERLNQLPGIALATLLRGSALAPGKMAATLKIIPYALPETVVRAAEEVAAAEPLLALAVFPPRRVALVLSGSAAAHGRIESSFVAALEPRLASWNARLEAIELVGLDDEGGEERLASVLGGLLDGGVELVILAGETAIMDPGDVAPRAVERAGGVVECFGAPVDPGNLLLLAYRGAAAIVGAPGCARSPKANIVDLVVPRLLVGDRLTRADVAALGHGGLLEDVPERPQPRSWLT